MEEVVMMYVSRTRDGTVVEVFENISEPEYDEEKNIVRFKDSAGNGVMFSGMALFLFLPDSVAVSEGDTVTTELQAQDIRHEVAKQALPYRQQIDQDETLVYLFETLLAKGLI
jgi:plastocyanin